MDETISFFSLSLLKGYRHRGIETKLMKCAVAFVKEIGVMEGDGTANYSERIFQKYRFEILSEVIYEDYKENEELVFKDCYESNFVENLKQKKLQPINNGASTAQRSHPIGSRIKDMPNRSQWDCKSLNKPPENYLNP